MKAPPPPFYEEPPNQSRLPNEPPYERTPPSPPQKKVPDGDDIDGHPFNEEDLIPSAKYYELPAGIMLPVIEIEQFAYKALVPDKLRMPPPVPPSQRLLNALDEFYSATLDPTREPALQAWGRGGCAEFMERKQRLKGILEEKLKRKKVIDDMVLNGFREMKIWQEDLNAEIKMKYDEMRRNAVSEENENQKEASPSATSKRKDRGRSRRSRSRSRSLSPGDRPSFGSRHRSPSPVALFRMPPAPLSSVNKGAQLMQKMGWSGTGLGASKQGILEPISGGEVRDRQDQFRGLGSTVDVYEQYRRQQYVGCPLQVHFDEGGKNDRLLVSTKESVFASLSANTGQIVWRRIQEDAKGVALPSVADETALYTVSDSGRVVRAWSKRNGALLWQTVFTEKADPSAPPFIVLASNTIVVSGSHRIAALSETGEIRWSTAVEKSHWSRISVENDVVHHLSILNGVFHVHDFSLSTGESIVIKAKTIKAVRGERCVTMRDRLVCADGESLYIVDGITSTLKDENKAIGFKIKYECFQKCWFLESFCASVLQRSDSIGHGPPPGQGCVTMRDRLVCADGESLYIVDGITSTLKDENKAIGFKIKEVVALDMDHLLVKGATSASILRLNPDGIQEVLSLSHNVDSAAIHSDTLVTISGKNLEVYDMITLKRTHWSRISVENDVVHHLSILNGVFHVHDFSLSTGESIVIKAKTIKAVRGERCVTMRDRLVCADGESLYIVDGITSTLKDENKAIGFKIKEVIALDMDHLLVKGATSASILRLKPDGIQEVLSLSHNVDSAAIHSDTLVTISGKNLEVYDMITLKRTYEAALPSDDGNLAPVETIYMSVKEAIELLIVRSDCRMEFVIIDTAKSSVVSEWVREEALARISTVEMVDLPLSELQQMIEDEFEEEGGTSGLMSSFIRRLISQTSQIQNHSGETLERDFFNLRKIIVATTLNGVVFGLDSSDGSIVWRLWLGNHFAPLSSSIGNDEVPLFVQRSTAHYQLPGQASVAFRDTESLTGVLIFFNPITGKVVERKQLPTPISRVDVLSFVGREHIYPLIVVGANKKISIHPPQPDDVLAGAPPVYILIPEGSRISGASINLSEKKLVQEWTAELHLATTEKIIAIKGKPRHQKMHSQGRVLIDRNVQYKYANPNLVAIATLDPVHQYLSIFLVDVVSGQMVHSARLSKATAPVHLVHCEHWIAYFFIKFLELSFVLFIVLFCSIPIGRRREDELK
ncbi:hypothetical protein COOONC_06671 [Cooperia oncophora]